ncbi:hypothetical protein [Calidifontibacillus oryziterrae]|uniref:hypothetical protein n=1 Tax=Calidifontibacillus oryziterrae TaxID=1191699 RepID=UPI000379261F|nr:hypothetical protein [Calidifontibacillus oryziterrae]
MLRSYKGFSIIEVLASFFVLFTTVMLLTPILLNTYQQRTMIDYKREALLLLHNEKASYLYNEGNHQSDEIEISTRKYQLSFEQFGQLVKLCVRWEVPWDENGKVCDFIKK